MKCPECQRLGLKSKVFPGSSSRTLMYCPPFYDKEGRFHDHDRNISATDYSCSNGHKWIKESSSSCWRGWPNKNE